MVCAGLSPHHGNGTSIVLPRIAGFFRGGIFSRIYTATIFRGKIFTNDTVFLITAVEISKFSQVKFSRIELDSRNS